MAPRSQKAFFCSAVKSVSEQVLRSSQQNKSGKEREQSFRKHEQFLKCSSVVASSDQIIHEAFKEIENAPT